jgi:hypothetical protein
MSFRLAQGTIAHPSRLRADFAQLDKNADHSNHSHYVLQVLEIIGLYVAVLVWWSSICFPHSISLYPQIEGVNDKSITWYWSNFKIVLFARILSIQGLQHCKIIETQFVGITAPPLVCGKAEAILGTPKSYQRPCCLAGSSKAVSGMLVQLDYSMYIYSIYFLLSWIYQSKMHLISLCIHIFQHNSLIEN